MKLFHSEYNDKLNKKLGKKTPEIVTYLIFVCCSIIITFFHEPWFDEAEAWQIAKCESYKNILLLVPHYEGHPPLWTLILSIPAKLGVPYEIGLKTVGLTISFINAYLIIFRSPFPKIVRLLLPFNFFLFYQYGVIVRPYGLMILLMLLLAILFPTKDSHPWRFTGILMLLCLIHAYGIMVAGGIAVCIVWDLLREKGFKDFINSLFKDQRIIALEVLLVLAILVIIDILPRDDTLATSVEATNSFLARLLCMLFTIFPDCLFFKSEWFYQDTNLLKTASISASGLISACIVGVLIWFILWLLSSKDKFKYLIIPYSFFAIFGAAVYMTAHHIGTALGILLFWLWIEFQSSEKLENWRCFKEKINTNPFDSNIVRAGVGIIVTLCLLVPIYWTASSSVKDIRKDYGYGRNLAAFIKEHSLDELIVYAQWDESFLLEDAEDKVDKNMFVGSDATYLAYFDENILDNVPNKEQAYNTHKYISVSESKKIAAEWAEKGAPDIIIGEVSSLYCENDYSIDDYTVVYVAQGDYFYKDGNSSEICPVYMRNDLLDRYGLTKVDTSDVFLSHYTITDEMKEAYNNGEITIEDIMDMTLGDWGKETA